MKKPDLGKVIDVMNMGVWEHAQSNAGGSLERVSTKGMSEKQIADNMKLLKKMGFTPRLYDSASLGGQTILLERTDAVNLHLMRRQFLAEEKWENGSTGHGIPITRIATRGLDQSHMVAIHNALKSENLEGAVLQSKNLGPTIRLFGDDAGRIEKFRADHAKGIYSLITIPKDDFGKKFMRAFNDVAAKVEKFVDGLKPKPVIAPYVADPRNFVRFMPAIKLDEDGKPVMDKARVVQAFKPPGGK